VKTAVPDSRSDHGLRFNSVRVTCASPSQGTPRLFRPACMAFSPYCFIRTWNANQDGYTSGQAHFGVKHRADQGIIGVEV
jgi:hypothetical protein